MNDLKDPTVTVIIPVKDREDELIRALQSVSRQTYKISEVIVVDDGSTRGLEPLAKKYFPETIVIRNETSKGAPYSRNRGWQSAVSDYVAFLDSDDEWESECLERKLDLMKRGGFDLVVGSVKLHDGVESRSIPFKVNPETSLSENLLGNNRFDARTSTFVIRRQLYDHLKFDEKLKKHQDWDLFLNAEMEFNISFTNYCDTIIHTDRNDRISSKLHTESTIYFVDKNLGCVRADYMFIFLVKMIFRAQRFRDQKSEAILKDFLRIRFSRLRPQNWIIRRIVLMGLSTEYLYKIRRLFN